MPRSPSTRSPTLGRPKSVRCRNKNSIPDWIDIALFEFVQTGTDKVKTYSDLETEKAFSVWFSVQTDPKKSKENIRNRFKYLRTLRTTNPPNFIQAYTESCSIPSPPPPAAAAAAAAAPATSAAAPATSAAAPASNPPSAAAASENGGGDDHARTATFNFGVCSNSAASSSSSPADRSNETTPTIMSLRNTFNQLDFERPENNPKGMWPIRNRNFTHNGMTVDKVELNFLVNEVRDAIHTDASIATDGNITLREPRIDDMYNTDADPVVRQLHIEAVQRMRNNNMSIRSTKFYIPTGMTIRTGPFSNHPTQISKEFHEAQMSFGEVDNDGLPIFHDMYWVKFTFAINGANENAPVRNEDINNLASCFGDIGM